MAITISGSGIVEANLADNAVTLAKMAGGTDGQIITYDASGNPAAVGPGTDGQVLTSTGSTTPPAFEAVAAGGTTPSFMAYRSSNQSISVTTETTIVFNSELFDSDSCYDTTNGRFTPTTAGKYFFSSSVRWSALDVGTLSYFVLVKNGTDSHEAILSAARSSSTSNMGTFNAVVDLNGSTDYVELKVYQSSGDRNIEAGGGKDSQFSGFKIG